MKKIHALPFWVYVALTAIFFVAEIADGLVSYLPTVLFPLSWIVVYIVARVKIARRKEEEAA
ncbi:MAG: hypothetical protein JW839_07990 [Candidatus Lokiarchaeota archaeon]|nr:hypothetical protein [Candidatus Lokiarchaeota archaeon]